MNMTRYLLAVIAVFIAVFVLEYLVHGVLLMGMYQETVHLWRPQEEANMMWMFLSQLAYAAVLVFIYTRHYEARGLGEGVRYGWLIGLLLLTLEIGKYVYMPIPEALWVAWMVAALVKGLVSGSVAGLVYKD